MAIVSVIVPNYNHAAFLEERLESIFTQSFRDFEVILLDDASTDKSVEILKKFSEYEKVSHFIINKKNSGSPFKQWKKGIDLAQGEYIWIAESDDFCESNFLETIFDFLAPLQNSPGVVYTQSIDVDEANKEIYNRINWTRDFEPNIWDDDFVLPGYDFIAGYLKKKNVIPNSSAVIFKKDLLQENVFSGDLLKMKMCGDWYFWIKLCADTQIGFISQPLNFFRSHSGVSRNHSDINKRYQRLLEESVIRDFLDQHMNVLQSLEVNDLYQKWFDLYKDSIFSKKIFKIKLKRTSKFAFVKRLMIRKFNRLLNLSYNSCLF